ncbi:MAG: hypothetical protein ACFFCQ_10675, partial [Promethearchaeota archaeon]
LCTTEKLVNVILPEKCKYSLNFVCGIINSPYASFYLSSLLFSKTTETSRVMDYPYSSLIPIPKVKFTAPQSYLNNIVERLKEKLELNSSGSEEFANELKQGISIHQSHVIHEIIDLIVQKIIIINQSIQNKQHEFINIIYNKFSEITRDSDLEKGKEMKFKYMELCGTVNWLTFKNRIQKTYSFPFKMFQELEEIYKRIRSQITKESKFITFLNEIVDELARIIFNLDKEHKRIVLRSLGEI